MQRSRLRSKRAVALLGERNVRTILVDLSPKGAPANQKSGTFVCGISGARSGSRAFSAQTYSRSRELIGR
jgi:hypothetical protein